MNNFNIKIRYMKVKRVHFDFMLTFQRNCTVLHQQCWLLLQINQLDLMKSS